MTRVRPHVGRCIALAAAVFGVAWNAAAQRVYWHTPVEVMAIGQTGQLTLVFENCSPKDGVPSLPPIDGVEMLSGMSRTEGVQMQNLSITKTVRFTYSIRVTREGNIAIPAFTAKTNKGDMTIPPLEFRVGAGTAVDIKKVIVGVLRASRSEVWLGEVFNVEFLLVRHANSSIEITGRSDIEWEPEGIVVESWGQPSDIKELNGQPVVGYRWAARCVANRAGVLVLPGARIKVRYLAGYRRFGIFTTPFNQDEEVISEAIEINVKSLPAPEPPEFSGAVGLFKMNSRIVPQSVSEGYPITWTLELSGAGNWNAGLSLPARDVSTDFHVPPSKSRLDQHENVIFDGTLTEDVVLIPTKPGDYTLGPVKWAFFNPVAGRYETIATEPVRVSVTPAPKSNQPAIPQQAPGGQTPASPQQPAEAVPPAPGFDAAPGLPHDVLSGAASALRPIGSFAMWLSLIPATALCIFWLWLAHQRSIATDNLAWRRRARALARDAIAGLRMTPGPAQRRVLLMRWMRATGNFCGLRAAAPRRQQFLEALKEQNGATPTAIDEWNALWREAEIALYSPNGDLPASWPARAEKALATRRLPRPRLFGMFEPRNLWPASALVVLLLAAPRASADEAIDAYRTGDFAKAEKLFFDRIVGRPTDWRARNNLAVALAQQGRWPEAVAHWTAARVQNPRNTAISWNLAIALTKAGMASQDFIATSKRAPRLSNLINAVKDANANAEAAKPDAPTQHADLVAIARPAGPARLVAMLSPAAWQWLVVAAALFGSVGFAIVLVAQHRSQFRRYGQPALAAPVIAALITVAAAFAHAHFGMLASRSAAIVGVASVLRSIPTDIEQQETKDLPAGTIGIIERQFLGWRLFRVGNGETGWVRGEFLVPVYDAPLPKRPEPSSQ